MYTKNTNLWHIYKLLSFEFRFIYNISWKDEDKIFLYTPEQTPVSDIRKPLPSHGLVSYDKEENVYRKDGVNMKVKHLSFLAWMKCKSRKFWACDENNKIEIQNKCSKVS